METKEVKTSREQEEKTEQGGTIFQHEDDKITIDLKSLKDRTIKCKGKAREKMSGALTPLKAVFLARRKAIIVIAVVLAAGAVIAAYGAAHIGYHGTLNRIVRIVNGREGDLDVIANALLPKEIKECYHKAAEVLGDNSYVENALELMEDNVDQKYGKLDDYFGTNARISIKVVEKEKMSPSQIRRAQKDYEEYYEEYWENFVSGIDKYDYDQISNLAKRYDLRTSDVMELRDHIDIAADYLKYMEITRGYNLTLQLKVKGSRDSYSGKIELRVIKVNGEWIVDYLSEKRAEKAMQRFGGKLENIFWFL